MTSLEKMQIRIIDSLEKEVSRLRMEIAELKSHEDDTVEIRQKIVREIARYLGNE